MSFPLLCHPLLTCQPPPPPGPRSPVYSGTTANGLALHHHVPVDGTRNERRCRLWYLLRIFLVKEKKRKDKLVHSSQTFGAFILSRPSQYKLCLLSARSEKGIHSDTFETKIYKLSTPHAKDFTCSHLVKIMFTHKKKNYTRQPMVRTNSGRYQI